jgi:hypothetical protein
VHKIFWSENFKGRHLFEYPAVNGRIILKRVINKLLTWVWNAIIGP